MQFKLVSLIVLSTAVIAGAAGAEGAEIAAKSSQALMQGGDEVVEAAAKRSWFKNGFKKRPLN